MQNFKMLLVDDEPIVIKDLKNMVDWNELGFTVVGSAHSGKSALKLYQELKPDVIITDIIMPNMNGLDFIHEIRKINPDIYLLILSSYGEFEYAKAAISEGVVDYLLKLEITPSSLTAKLKDIYIKLSSSKIQNKKAVRLELQEYFNRSDANEFTWTFQNIPDHKKFFFMIFTTPALFQSEFLNFPVEKDAETLLCKLESILADLNLPEDTILFHQNSVFILGVHARFIHPSAPCSITALIKGIFFHKLLNNPGGMRAVYLDFPITLFQFFKKYRNLIPLINWNFLLNGELLVHVSVLESQHYHNFAEYKTFDQLSFMHTHQEQVQYIKDYVRKLFENHDFFGIQKNFLYVCSVLRKTPTVQYLSEMLSDEKSYERFLMNGFESWKASSSSQTVPAYSTVINHAIQYICIHYMDYDLNLDAISNYIGLSSGRLSVLFKKETKQTPNDWITHYRIEASIKLLLHSNYKIYEISEKVGYRSSQYFSRIFYQHTGKKPLDYRKNSSITYALGDLRKCD